MNGDANGPDEAGAAPPPEAGRVGSRLKALRQRSSAIQDQVSRRRAELERSLHEPVAGFPLAVSVQKTLARAWRVPMLTCGWVVTAAFGAVYWERLADQDTVIQAELNG